MTDDSRDGMLELGRHDVARLIDHAILRPDLDDRGVGQEVELALRYAVWSVCCRPSDVARAVAALHGSTVRVGTVIGFPHGSATTATKVFEAHEALEAGASELDMVLHIGRLRSGQTGYVQADIESVVRAAPDDVIVKVILETAFLTDEQKRAACRAAVEAGAHFVKTSTGFTGTGATLEDVRLMRASVPEHMQVKASGGVRSLPDVVAFVGAGATRIGTPATAAILDAFDTEVLDATGSTVAAGGGDAY
jgi:deoxyribose-phosphate aldolase